MKRTATLLNISREATINPLCFLESAPGEVISEKDRCKKCEGKKVVKEVKILEVHVDKGMKHGQKITFGGEADQAPGVEPGDIVLVLQEKDHEVGQPIHRLAFGSCSGGGLHHINCEDEDDQLQVPANGASADDLCRTRFF